MKTKHLITPFLIDGRSQEPKDLDFSITPSLVFSTPSEDVSDLGWAFAIGLKWGYYAVGIYVFGAYIK